MLAVTISMCGGVQVVVITACCSFYVEMIIGCGVCGNGETTCSGWLMSKDVIKVRCGLRVLTMCGGSRAWPCMRLGSVFDVDPA